MRFAFVALVAFALSSPALAESSAVAVDAHLLSTDCMVQPARELNTERADARLSQEHTVMQNTNIGAFVRSAPGTVPVAAAAGTRNGTGIDRRGYGSCKLFAQTGAITGSPSAQSLNAKIQHSTDNVTFEDYTPPQGSAAIAPLTAANSSASVDVDLSSARRYIRVVEVVAFTGGTSPTIGASSSVVLGGARTLPAT